MIIGLGDTQATSSIWDYVPLPPGGGVLAPSYQVTGSLAPTNTTSNISPSAMSDPLSPSDLDNWSFSDSIYSAIDSATQFISDNPWSLGVVGLAIVILVTKKRG